MLFTFSLPVFLDAFLCVTTTILHCIFNYKHCDLPLGKEEDDSNDQALGVGSYPAGPCVRPHRCVLPPVCPGWNIPFRLITPPCFTLLDVCGSGVPGVRVGPPFCSTLEGVLRWNPNLRSCLNAWKTKLCLRRWRPFQQPYSAGVAPTPACCVHSPYGGTVTKALRSWHLYLLLLVL